MVKEIIIPKENYKKVEEVRELENENQEQKKADEKQKNKPTVTEDEVRRMEGEMSDNGDIL